MAPFGIDTDTGHCSFNLPFLTVQQLEYKKNSGRVKKKAGSGSVLN